MNSCEAYQEMISRLVDGEISREEHAALMEHLKSCSNCNAMFAVFHDLSDILSEEPEELPVGLHENIMAGVRRSAIIKKNRRMRKFGLRMALTAAACAVLVLVGTTGFGRRELKDTTSIRSEEAVQQLLREQAAGARTAESSPAPTATAAQTPAPQAAWTPAPQQVWTAQPEWTSAPEPAWTPEPVWTPAPEQDPYLAAREAGRQEANIPEQSETEWEIPFSLPAPEQAPVSWEDIASAQEPLYSDREDELIENNAVSMPAAPVEDAASAEEEEGLVSNSFAFFSQSAEEQDGEMTEDAAAAEEEEGLVSNSFVLFGKSAEKAEQEDEMSVEDTGEVLYDDAESEQEESAPMPVRNAAPELRVVNNGAGEDEPAFDAAEPPTVRDYSIRGTEARIRLLLLLGGNQAQLPAMQPTRIIRVRILPDDDFGDAEKLEIRIYGDFIFFTYDPLNAEAVSFRADCPVDRLDAWLSALPALSPTPAPTEDPFSVEETP